MVGNGLANMTCVRAIKDSNVSVSVCRPIAALLVVSLSLACGPLGFDAPEIDIEMMTVSFANFPDTLTIGDSTVVEVYVRDQRNQDVTAFPQTVFWLVEPVSVAGLVGRRSLGETRRILIAIDHGQAEVTVIAFYTPRGELVVTSEPVTKVVVVVP